MPNAVNPVKQRYSVDFKRVYSNGAIGGYDGYDFIITFFRDNIQYAQNVSTPPHVEREIVSEIILPAPALKEITKWLLSRVNEIEEANGIIREPSLKSPAESREKQKSERVVAAAYS
ncbi:MAG: DUF3467 domain-containing protein [Candidatus Bathyarchaeia archaeon]